jgi:hypothetical protein
MRVFLSLLPVSIATVEVRLFLRLVKMPNMCRVEELRVVQLIK